MDQVARTRNVTEMFQDKLHDVRLYVGVILAIFVNLGDECRQRPTQKEQYLQGFGKIHRVKPGTKETPHKANKKPRDQKA